MDNAPGWSEENSRSFIDFARYYVPDREAQMDVLCSLVPEPAGSFQVLELACGPGLLAEKLLDRYPACAVRGLDGSELMLETARRRLAGYGSRFTGGLFDLASTDWREKAPRYQAVLSSLAIHHLDDTGKAALFRDIYPMLLPGGVFLVADILRPAGLLGNAYAARAYDEIVRRQALEIDGDERAFEQFKNDQWNLFRYPDDALDRPSRLLDQLNGLVEVGFANVDVFWLNAGHAIFGGEKPA